MSKLWRGRARSGRSPERRRRLGTAQLDVRASGLDEHVHLELRGPQPSDIRPRSNRRAREAATVCGTSAPFAPRACERGRAIERKPLASSERATRRGADLQILPGAREALIDQDRHRRRACSRRRRAESSGRLSRLGRRSPADGERRLTSAIAPRPGHAAHRTNLPTTPPPPSPSENAIERVEARGGSSGGRGPRTRPRGSPPRPGRAA